MCWALLIKGKFEPAREEKCHNIIKLLNSHFPISLSFWDKW
jgi:hypothetical protein